MDDDRYTPKYKTKKDSYGHTYNKPKNPNGVPTMQQIHDMFAYKPPHGNKYIEPENPRTKFDRKKKIFE